MNKTAQANAEGVVSIIPRVMWTLAAELRRSGHLLMPAQFGVFIVLSEQQECSLSALAEHLSVSLPTMSNIITRMVDRGWVRRARSQADRRVVLVSLTPAGVTMLETLHLNAVDRIASLLDSLPPGDQADLKNGLAVLRSVFAGP